ncbi:hypothetical protein Tco_0920288 [Tanacetum coccineum]
MRECYNKILQECLDKSCENAMANHARMSYIPHRDRTLSISEEALGAFVKSQTYSAKDIYMGRRYYRGQEVEHKQVKLMEDRRDKLETDDTLVCCVKNMVKDRIIDYGASFHATYCKEELERLKLCSGKVRLADDM